MKKLLFITAILILFVAGCSDDDKFVNDPPDDLSFYINSDSTAVLRWEHSPDYENEDFLHYAIFRQNSPFDAGAEELDTVNAAEIFTSMADSLIVPTRQNTRYYYVAKTVLDREERWSDRSNSVNLAGTISGTDTIYQVGLGDEYNCGFGFDDEGAMGYPMIADNQNDIFFYFGTVNEDDSPGQPAIKSPHLYSSTYLNETMFKELGFGSWRTFNTVSDAGMAYYLNMQIGGQVIGIKTPDNHYVKINFVDISSVDGTYYKAVFNWSYQPIVNYPVF